MKYVKNNVAVKATQELISNHGLIRHIHMDGEPSPIGYVFRKEILNNNDCAKVIFNVSLITDYIKNNKFFTSKEYKYFGIKHLNDANINDKSTAKLISIIGQNDETIESLMRLSIKNEIKSIDSISELINVNKSLTCSSKNCSSDCSKCYIFSKRDLFYKNIAENINKIIDFIYDVIISVVNYYKDKKIFIYFSF